jgi:hypothetical protein
VTRATIVGAVLALASSAGANGTPIAVRVDAPLDQPHFVAYPAALVVSYNAQLAWPQQEKHLGSGCSLPRVLDERLLERLK